MTATGLWLDIGAGENVFTKFLRLVFLLIAAVIFCFLATLPLTWPQQAVLGVISVTLALVIASSSDSYLVTLALMMLSLFCTFRYGYWRILQVVRYFHDPASHIGALNVFFILCLLLAEIYAFGILFLGYFQTIWPLRRAPVPLPDNPDEWPDIDVVITTYNEPLEVVRYTALGALNMDWPVEKLHVYLLDDGRRKEFEDFAREAGIGYRTRPDNRYAKAGNINAALPTITSPYIAIFDSDHVPTRSFLQMTLGWFLRDRKLAVLQTPHHFYSPDPFERNLGQFRIIPNEGELFYGIVQDGNDFWNSSFFCGSCAVLRRSALNSVGGIATDTVTEDAHTSLRMQMRGWNSAYVNIPQAAGLATERLSAHIGQRIRWARGMVQILRTDNPLFAPGLTFAQRLCYFNAMGHFLYAVPRLIFLTAPLIYLLLNHTNIPGYWLAILAYALPHLTLSNVTNSRIQGEHRYSFWNEIYETVLAPYILLPTMMALVNPKSGRFNVTSKGGVVKDTYFDSRIAQPFLVMLLFNILGLSFAIPRFLIWDRDRQGTVLMNVLWCCFNIVILGVCTAVARELQQRRSTVRIQTVTPLMIKLPGGKIIPGETFDISGGGTGILLREPPPEPTVLAPESKLQIAFPNPSTPPNPPAPIDLPATVIALEGSVLRVSFKDLTIPQQEVLTRALYSRADSWLGWGQGRESDNVLRSLGRIFQISMRGLKSTAQTIASDKDGPSSGSTPLSIAPTSILILAAALLTAAAPKSLAQTPPPNRTNPTNSTNPANRTNSANSAIAANPAISANPAVLPAGQYHDSFTLADAGSPQIEFHNIESTHNISFSLPQTHVIRAAKMHVVYAFSPGLLPQLSHLKLSINGTLFATIQPTAGASGGSDGRTAEADLPIPPELLVHQNALTIEFIGHYAANCEDPASTTLWARVLRSSAIETTGDLLPLADDLKQLPAPFVDPAVVQPASINIVFLAAPSLKAIQAAGIVASYFGMVSEKRPVRFPVSIGAIPAGNAIVIAENPAALPPALNLASPASPTVAMRTNPNDPYSKLLVITGSSADDAIAAAQAVAIGGSVFSGAQTSIDTFKLPSKRSLDDAPRWARTDQAIPLWDYASTDQLQGDGTAPLKVDFRIPPDLYFDAPFNSDHPNATLHLDYRYNSVPIGPSSSMQVRANNAFLGSVPLIPGQETSRATQTNVAVPVVNLRPFSNSLSFDFTFQWLRKQHCDDTTPINMQGAILRDSSLDLRGYQHWAAMPNLEIFANAGFPFTRFADLSETTVVLPPAPSIPEIETFVTLMGHFSRQTGFPALRVTVAGPDALRDGAQTDFLILGTGDDQPAFDKLGTHLPVAMRTGQVQVHDTQGLFPLFHDSQRFFPFFHGMQGFFSFLHGHQWWKVDSNDQHSESGDLTAAGTPDAIIEDIESPYDVAGNRSIVAIHLSDAADSEPFLSTFLQVQQASDIAQSVSVLHNSQFISYRLGSATYHVGALTWFTTLTLWFAQVPWLGALIVLGIALLLAVWTRQWLRGKARSRLTLFDE
jgi:cellulose synthase (UDP-forming)